MGDLQFGTLKKVDLRDIWPHEAVDFTPWLAAHLPELGEALGLDIELQTSEAPVGDFSLDILARDLGRDRPVIIENQLEHTDHDHLGKLLTYASGYDAGTIVWIAREMREEHRQALDWLNQHTDASVEFFGVVVEVLRIDDSLPAYSFKLVAFPNEWKKTALSSGASAPTEKGTAYRAFFQNLMDCLREQHKFTKAKTAFPQNWYTFASGTTGIGYGANFTANQTFRVEVVLDRATAEQNKHLFDKLYEERSHIEEQLGETLSWERLDDKKMSRIAVYRQGSIGVDSELLDDIRNWAIDHLLQFKKVFGPRITKLV